MKPCIAPQRIEEDEHRRSSEAGITRLLEVLAQPVGLRLKVQPDRWCMDVFCRGEEARMFRNPPALSHHSHRRLAGRRRSRFRRCPVARQLD